MTSFPVFFLRAVYAHFLHHSSSSDFCFLLSGPTPIHAPRPLPITYSVGIGTSDFGVPQADAVTQGGPPPLEMSSFLQDLSLGAVSSPVARAPVSVLSPNFQRFLDRESAIRSPPPPPHPPPPRVTVDAGVSAVVTPVDVAVDACVAVVDQSIQAVVETGETSTDYDPPVETLSAAPSSPAASVPEVVEADVEQSDVPSTDSTETLLEAVEDVPAGDPLSVEPALEGAVPGLVPAPAETSPMGPSLVDSDDEPIASRLPGYLNSFNPVKYLIGNFYSFLFSFSLSLAFFTFFFFSIDFPSFFCFHYIVFCSFLFSITFSSSKVLNIAFFFSGHFLELSISFTSLKFLVRLLAIFVVSFSVYLSFSSLSYFRSKISQFWFKVVLYISFSSFEAFVFYSFNFLFWWLANTSLFHLFVFASFFAYISNENIILHHVFITPGERF